jgi:hypothetical protein
MTRKSKRWIRKGNRRRTFVGEQKEQMRRDYAEKGGKLCIS